MIRALGKYNKHAYVIDSKFISSPQELKEKAAEIEFICPYCGIPVQLASYKDGNINKPHFKATGAHSHNIECEEYQEVETFSTIQRMVTYGRGKALAVMNSEVVDFKNEIKPGIIYRVQQKDLKIENVRDWKGTKYCQVSLGNVFKDGVQFSSKYIDINIASNEEVLILASMIIPKVITSKKTNKDYTINQCKPFTIRLAKPTFNGIPWEDPYEKEGQ